MMENKKLIIGIGLIGVAAVGGYYLWRKSQKPNLLPVNTPTFVSVTPTTTAAKADTASTIIAAAGAASGLINSISNLFSQKSAGSDQGFDAGAFV